MKLKFLLALISVLAAVEIAPESAAKGFLTGTNYPSGEYPSAAVVQDLNNDQIADIVSANSNDANLSVFLGKANGTFAAAMNFSVGGGAAELASADLNGDGKADLAVTDGIRSVHVVLGNGDGTFGAPTSFTLRNPTVGVEIADLDRDGKLDLAVANFGPPNNSQGEIAILLGNGDGSFATPVYYRLDHNAGRITAADLNGDGKLDLAVALQHFAHEVNSLAVLLGNGDGTFQTAMTSVSGSAYDVAAGDLNGDGKVDLTLAANPVRVLLGNGDGTFQSAVDYPVGGYAGTVQLSDLDHDGRPDLVVGGGHVNLLRGRGDGSFAPVVTYGIGNRFATMGDFNRDDSADIVAGGGFSAIGVAFGRGDGTFRAPLVYFPNAGLSSMASADFNSDGHTDVAVGGSILLGDGAGGLIPGIAYTTMAANWVRTDDFNGDGKPDILVATLGFGGIFVFLGNGDGTFQAAKGPFLADDDLWPEVNDFNNDGRLDVAVTHTFQRTLSILLGKGDGTFRRPMDYATGDIPQSPTSSDFNGDGKIDLAVSNTFENTVGIYLGNGDGTFQNPLTTPALNALYSAAADFNRDGHPDLILGGDGLKVFLGMGDGTFQPPQTVHSGYGPMSLADVDGDGLLDVMVSDDFATLTVLRGKSDGIFHRGTSFPTGAQFVGHNILTDLNHDGRPEAVAEDISDSVAVLRNTSKPRP
jgi:FG-GAP-like repeat